MSILKHHFFECVKNHMLFSIVLRVENRPCRFSRDFMPKMPQKSLKIPKQTLKHSLLIMSISKMC